MIIARNQTIVCSILTNRCKQITISNALFHRITIEISDQQTIHIRPAIRINNSNSKQIRMYEDDQHQTTINPTTWIHTNGDDAAIWIKRIIRRAKIILAALLKVSVLRFVAKQIDAGNAVTFLISSIQISNFIKQSLGIYSDLIKNIGATKRIFV